MNEIDRLLTEVCPNGVEFRELEELFTTRGGYTPSKTDVAAWSEGTVPWFRMEDIRDNGRILSDSIQHINVNAVKRGRLFPANSILIATSATIGEHALVTVPHLSNQRFTSISLRPEWASRFDIKFVFYYCFVLDEWCKNNTTRSSFATVNMAGFKRFKFPVPPMSVQRKIVSILDRTERLSTELEANLEAELDYRTRQYAFYRDRLMSFDETGSVRWSPMGEAGQFFRGKRFTKADYAEAGIPCIHYGEIYTHFRTVATSVVSHLRNDLRSSLRFARTSDIVIVDVGETVEDVGKAVAWLGDDDVAVHDHCYVFRHEMNPAFVSYYMQTARFHAEKAKHVARTKVKTLLMDGLARVSIPVPSLPEQERIVGILDRYDALVSDLALALPVEVSVRREQHEYYRARLLTFKEAHD